MWDLNGSIDKDTPVPLYYQLKQKILFNINNGNLQPGDLFPSEVELCKLYSISRPTVRQAISELVSDGYLHRQRGKGTIVTKPKITQDFIQRIEPYDEQMLRLGLTPSTHVIQFSKMAATPEVAKALNLEEGADVVFLKRLRFANGDPVVLVSTYLPGECEPLLESNIAETGLYNALSKDETLAIASATRQIEAIISTRDDSKVLDIPMGYPIQLITSIGYSKDNRPIEYSVAKYRGDKSKFIVHLVV